MSIRDRQKNQKSGRKNIKPGSAPSRLSSSDNLPEGFIPSQKFFETIIDNIPHPTFIKDRKHRWVVLNMALSDLVGYSREKMLGKSDYDFFPKAQADFFWKKDEEMFRTGKVIDIPEEPITDKKGKIHYLHTKKAPLRDSSGRITHLVGIIEDITERKKAEEALQTARDRLELVTRHIGVGLAIISKDYRTLWANEVLKQIFGDVEGKTCYSTYNQRTGVCPECGVRKVFQTGKSEVVHEQVGQDKFGKTIWSQIIATPIKDKKGDITAAIEVVVPITERKRTERALRESEEKYRLLVENIKEGIYSTEKGVFVSVNESMCKMFGYTKEELIGMPTWNLAVPEIRNGVRKMFFEKAAKKEYSPVEVECIRKDGTVFFAEIRLSAFSEKQKSLGVVSDVTDRKRTDETLKESEEKYRTLFESAPESVVIVGLDGVILDCNKEALKIGGLPKEALVGKHYTKLSAFNEKDMQKARELFSRIIAGESPKSFEIKSTVGGNRAIWVEVFPALLKKDKQAYAAQFITRDITERKRAEEVLHQSEEKYRLLVENANEAIIIAQDGWLKFVNPKMTEIMGYSKDELLSQPFVGFIHPEDQKMVSEHHVKRLKGEELPHVYSFRITDKDGNVKWLEINAVLIDWEGRPATLNFLSDITQRKQMEKLLIQKEKTARERARLLTDLHHLYEIDEILNRVCQTVRDSGLFERAVMTLHEPEGKIVNLGQVGLPQKIVERARQAAPLDRKLISRITHKNFRISDSFFIPIEAGLDLTKSGRYVPQKRKRSVNGNWQAGDELFVPLRDFSGEIMGYLSVDTPFDGCRPDVETIQALEMIVEAAAARVREVEANKAVQSSESKYRTLVETAQVGISLMDPEENIVFVNQAGANLLGYRKEELLSKKLKDICDEAQYAMLKNELKKRKKGESSKYEAKLLTRSGKLIHVHVSSAPLWSEDGSFMGSLTILSDLTEIKKAREYNILFNASRALSQTLKFEQVLRMGAEKMMETLKADKSAVLLTENHAGELPTKVYVYDYKDGKNPASVINLKITPELLSIFQRTLRTRGYVQISDARIDPVPELGKKILRQAKMKSSLIIPIILGEKMLAIFHVGTGKETKTYDLEEIGLVRTMANQVATALQNCKLMEDLERNHARIIKQTELLKTQYREQKMLFELAQALTSTANLDQLLNLACQKVTELLNTERSSIALVNSDAKSYTLRALYPRKGETHVKVLGFTFRPEVNPELEKLVVQQEPFIVNDTSCLPKQNSARKYFLSRGIKSSMAVPLKSRGRVLGFITAGTTEKLHNYTKEELRLLQTVSNPIAVSIENYLLLEDLKQQAQTLKKQTHEKDILLNVIQALSQTMELDEVFKVSTQIVASALEVDRCAVFVPTPDGKHVEVKGIFSQEKREIQKVVGTKYPTGDDPRWRDLVAKRRHFFLDITLESLPSDELREHCLREGIKSVFITGMFFGKRFVGILAISCTKEHKTFSPDEIRLIQTIANQIAVALENARLMQVVKVHSQELKQLSSQLMKAHESERKKIAQELHDEVGQMLQSMKMNLDRIRRNLTGEPTRLEDTKDWLIDTEKLLSQTIDDIRTLTFDLRPSMLDDFGLISTLRWYIEDFTKRSNIQVVLKGKEEKYRFPLEIEINLYRIIQEALTNVAKHSQATEVTIFLSQKDSTQTGGRLPTVILSVKDNGVGFDAGTLLSSPHKGMGVFNMKERVNLLGGSFEIISQPHKGTRVNVKIPFMVNHSR